MAIHLELSLPEALLLIALDDEKGSDTSGAGLDAGLAGGLLLELTLSEHLVQEAKHLVAAATILRPAGLIGEALAVVARDAKPRKPKHWVDKLPRELKPLKARVAEGLVAAGVVAEERRKILGLFPDTRYPTTNPAVESALRERLRGVLVLGASPDPRTVLLAALLEPLDLVKRVVDKSDRREAKRRAKALAQEVPVSGAVARTVQDATTAIVMATSASVATSDGGGGGDGGGSS